MQAQILSGCGGRATRLLVVLALIAAAVLATCSPATALRPRTTPTNAARLAALQDGGAGPAQSATLHEGTVARILARHAAAAGGAAVVTAGRSHRARWTHHGVVVGAQGTLAVATLAALAAIVLVVVAVIAGEHRQMVRRRRAEEAKRVAAPLRRRQPAS
jgi:hypothetical protein